MYAKIIDDHVSEQLAAARTDIGLELVRNLANMVFVGKEARGLAKLCGYSNGPVYSKKILDLLDVQPEKTPFVCEHTSKVKRLFSLVLPFEGLNEVDVWVGGLPVPGLSENEVRHRVFEALTSEHDRDYLQLKKVEDPQHPCCGERGVFANRTIPKGFVFWPYAGVATTNTMLDTLEYQGSCHLHNVYSWEHTTKAVPGLAFDGLLVRGVLGYVNDYHHVPRANRANVHPVDVGIKTHGSGSLPFVIYVTSEKISIGEELLVNYGKRYFSHLKPLEEAYEKEKKKYKEKLEFDKLFKDLKISEERANRKKMEAYRSKQCAEEYACRVKSQNIALAEQYQKLQLAEAQLKEKNGMLEQRNLELQLAEAQLKEKNGMLEQRNLELQLAEAQLKEQKAQLEVLTRAQSKKISHVENKNKQMVKDSEMKKHTETAGGTTIVRQTCECVYGRVWNGAPCDIGERGLMKHWVGKKCRKMALLLEKYGIDNKSLNTLEAKFARDDAKKTPKKGITGDYIYPILICQHNPEHRWSRHSGITRTMHNATCRDNTDTEAHKRLQDETALKKLKLAERMTALGLEVTEKTTTALSLYAVQAAKQFWDTKATGNIQSNGDVLHTQERRKLRVSNSLFHDIIAFQKAMEKLQREDDAEAREFMLDLFKLKITIACDLNSEEKQELHGSLLDALETWDCNKERGAVTDAELLESPFFPLIKLCKKFLARTSRATGQTRPRGQQNDTRGRDRQRRRTNDQRAESSNRQWEFGGQRWVNDRGNGGGRRGNGRSREFPEGSSDTYEGSYGQSRPGRRGY